MYVLLLLSTLSLKLDEQQGTCNLLSEIGWKKRRKEGREKKKRKGQGNRKKEKR